MPDQMHGPFCTCSTCSTRCGVRAMSVHEPKCRICEGTDRPLDLHGVCAACAPDVAERRSEEKSASRRVIAMGIVVDFEREPDGRTKPSTEALRLEVKIALNRSLHELGKALDAARWEGDELLIVGLTRTMAAISRQLDMANTLRARPW